MFSRCLPLFLGVGFLAAGCYHSHQALVQTAALPAPPDPVVRHSKRLWIELEPEATGAQCVAPEGHRPLCFEDVDRALASSLGRAHWTSFPEVRELGFRDAPEPGDYVLKIDLRLDALPPSVEGPGWAALARGRWQLLRDGAQLAGERVESRSRADFGYGRPLGVGAGEVVDAVAFHVGVLLGTLPESAPDRPLPLPAVSARALEPAPQQRQIAVREPRVVLTH